MDGGLEWVLIRVAQSLIRVGQTKDSSRILRGGSWDDNSPSVRSGFRFAHKSGDRRSSWLPPLPRTFSLTAMNPFFRTGLFLFLFSHFLTGAEPMRTWTSSDGRTLEARFIEQVGSNVKIKTEAGREFTLPITRFSQADQEYVVEAAARALFRIPEPFEDRGKGAIIIASATGKVTVIPASRYSGSQEVKPVARDVIVGEPLPHGSTIMTGANSEADLLLTTGSLAKVGPNSKLVLSAFWQKDFRASAKKVTDLKEETSPSRVALKLETGDLVVDVKN